MTNTRDNVPPSTTIGTIFAKTIIGLIVGAVLGFVFFFLLTIAGSAINVAEGGGPLLPILLLIITLISTFVGMAILIATYSMFYGDEYYDFGMMFRYVVMTNMVIFLFLIPVYLFFMGNIANLFFVMALHIALSVYVCLMQLDMMANPHYAISSSIGATLGLVWAMLVYSMTIAIVNKGVIQDNLHRYIVLPPVLMYGLIPLGQGVWRMIYTRLYESGSDTLYLPTPSELQQMANEQDEQDDVVTVDM